jgi:hypothetical protein
MRLVYPEKLDVKHAKQLYLILAFIPLGLATLQIIMMTTCYKYETPVILAKKGEKEKLDVFMNKMYANDPSVIPERIKELTGEDVVDTSNGEKE